MRGVERSDWLHLGDDEEILWVGRPSRYTIAFGVIGGLLLGLAGVLLTWWIGPHLAASRLPAASRYIPLLISIVGVLLALFVYLNWLRLVYVITNEEIYVKHGLVSRDVTQIRLGRVQNTTFEQSILERILQFGDVCVYTAGSSTEDLTLKNVPNPQSLTRLLTERLGEHHRYSGQVI